MTLAAGEFATDRGARGQHSGHLLRCARARGRRAPRVRQHAEDDPVFRARDRRALSIRQVCAGRGQRFYFRRDGKHVGDHADRRHAARRARASRFQQRSAGRARAGASMVGRFADLPRLGARVAQRRLRDLLRGAVVRGESRAPTSSRGTCARIARAISTRTRNHYRRPIVCNRYRAPIDLFDRHLYEKGSLVLHMLRRVIGDELFFKSLNLYCTRHRGAQRDHAGPAARVRGRDRTQPGFFLRPVGVQGRASGNRSHELVRRQAEAAQRHGQADAQDLATRLPAVHAFR